jgi:hypothetical protein
LHRKQLCRNNCDGLVAQVILLEVQEHEPLPQQADQGSSSPLPERIARQDQLLQLRQHVLPLPIQQSYPASSSSSSSSPSSLLTSAAVHLQKARIRVIVAMEVSVFQALDKFFGPVILELGVGEV